MRGKGQEILSWKLVPDVNPGWALSPDGERLARLGHSPRSRAIRLVDAHSGTILRDIDVSGAIGLDFDGVNWAHDGTGLYLTGESSRGVSLVFVDLDGHANLLYEQAKADLYSIKPSLDGRHVAWGEATWDSNIWRIENFRP